MSLSARGPRDELTVEIDRGLAGSLGLTVAQVGQAMRVAFAGIDAGDWVDPSGKTRDVRIRLQPEARRNPSDLARLPLTVIGSDGKQHTVPLGHVARITLERAPAQIDHLDRSRVITLEANTYGRAAQRGDRRHEGEACDDRLPAGLCRDRRRLEPGTERHLLQHLHRARHRGDADVPDPGGAVRVVPRPARDPGLTPALAHWRGDRAASSRAIP